MSYGGAYTPEQAKAALAARQKNALVTNGRPKAKAQMGTHIYLDTIGNGRTIYLPPAPTKRSGRMVLGEIPDIPDQEQVPENPGVRKTVVSTYGIAIPISTGRRRVGGNVIWASPAVPIMIGSYDYYVKIPLKLIPEECCTPPEGSESQCVIPGSGTTHGSDCGGAGKSGPCVDIYTSTKVCVNYDTGKYAQFTCVPVGDNGGWNCETSASNVLAAPVGFDAFLTIKDDGGAAQCDFCERVGIYDTSQECIEGIEEVTCNPSSGPS